MAFPVILAAASAAKGGAAAGAAGATAGASGAAGAATSAASTAARGFSVKNVAGNLKDSWNAFQSAQQENRDTRSSTKFDDGYASNTDGMGVKEMLIWLEEMLKGFKERMGTNIGTAMELNKNASLTKEFLSQSLSNEMQKNANLTQEFMGAVSANANLQNNPALKNDITNMGLNAIGKLQGAVENTFKAASLGAISTPLALAQAAKDNLNNTPALGTMDILSNVNNPAKLAMSVTQEASNVLHNTTDVAKKVMKFGK